MDFNFWRIPTYNMSDFIWTTVRALILLYPSDPSALVSFPVWDLMTELNPTIRQSAEEFPSSSHSSATMKLAISHCAVITIGFCQNAIMAENAWAPATAWLWLVVLSTLLYLHKVQRVKHIIVLDLFRKNCSQWKWELWEWFMHDVFCTVCYRSTVIKRRKMNLLINWQCWLQFTVGSCFRKRFLHIWGGSQQNEA